MSEPNKKGIVYVRVSSLEQVDGTSLGSQEKICREYAQKHGIDVGKVFIEKGESAKTADRTEFNKAIAFCADKRNKINFFVVYKLDRFARNQDDHGMVRATLKRYGVMLRSVTEPIDETAVGRLMESVISGVAEFDNSIRSERSKNGMVERVKEGYWMWNEPLGYKRLTKGGNLVVDEEKAQYVKLAFEEWSKESHTYRSLAKYLYERGFRTRSGGKIYPQFIQKMLSNPIYFGRIEAFGIQVQGRFKPIIDEQLFYKCNPKLVKKNHTEKRRKKINPDFPLRNLVTCSECDTKLTASYSKGNGGKYPYYHHQKQGCPKAAFTPKVTFEQNFSEFLGELSLKEKKYEKAFKEIVIDVWQSNYKKLDFESQQIEKEINNLKIDRQKVFDFHKDGHYSDGEFLEQKDLINQKISEKEVLRCEKKIEEFDMEEALDHCFSLARDTAKTWIDLADVPEFQYRFQNIVFPGEKITYDGEKFGTDKVALVYEINQQSGTDKSQLVTLRGIEPRFPP